MDLIAYSFVVSVSQINIMVLINIFMINCQLVEFIRMRMIKRSLNEMIFSTDNIWMIMKEMNKMIPIITKGAMTCM